MRLSGQSDDEAEQQLPDSFLSRRLRVAPNPRAPHRVARRRHYPRFRSGTSARFVRRPGRRCSPSLPPGAPGRPTQRRSARHAGARLSSVVARKIRAVTAPIRRPSDSLPAGAARQHVARSRADRANCCRTPRRRAVACVAQPARDARLDKSQATRLGQRRPTHIRFHAPRVMPVHHRAIWIRNDHPVALRLERLRRPVAIGPFSGRMRIGARLAKTLENPSAPVMKASRFISSLRQLPWSNC